MSIFARFLSVLTLAALGPVMAIGFVAAVLWTAMECGWWWGLKWVEWSFDKEGALTWTAKIKKPQ